MSAGKKIGLAVLGIGSVVVLRMPLGRVVTTVAIAKRVWDDPKVQKVRRRVQKQVEKRAAKGKS